MANIYLGGTDLSSATLKMGSTDVSAAYLGSTEVWSYFPSIISDFSFFYDANEGDTFTNLSSFGSGRDGSIQTAGTSASTLTATTFQGGRVWDFDTSDGTVSQKYVLTNFTPGACSSFSFVGVVGDKDLSKDAYFCGAEDNSNDNFKFQVVNSTDQFLARASDGTRRSIYSSAISANTLYFVVVTYDSTNKFRFWVNNSLVGSDSNTINLDVNTEMGLGFKAVQSITWNDFYIGAVGFYKNYSLDSTDRTTLYNYYNAIYSF